MKKKAAAANTITNTPPVVTSVSLRVGQVTLAPSERTSCKNWIGFSICDPSEDAEPNLQTRPRPPKMNGARGRWAARHLKSLYIRRIAFRQEEDIQEVSAS